MPRPLPPSRAARRPAPPRRSSAPFLLLALSACGTVGRGGAIRPSPIPSSARQLVLVIADGWDAPTGRLQRFERDGREWKPVSAPVDAMLGRNGLGWGLGLHYEDELQGPRKQEGDGRAPAGIFRLSSAFGYAPTAAHLPYTVATPTLECVDDPASRRYNTLVDAAAVARDWSSSEKIRRDDELYRVGVFVSHNAPDGVPLNQRNSAGPRPIAARGSCVFLHVWRGPGQPTAGCTATAGDEMEKLVRWLDAEKEPVLVQLPRREYDALAGMWRLPVVPNPNDPCKKKP